MLKLKLHYPGLLLISLTGVFTGFVIGIAILITTALTFRVDDRCNVHLQPEKENQLIIKN